MTIYKSSRYANSEIDYLSVVENGDVSPVVKYEFADLSVMSWIDYCWKDGDRLESISYQFYKTPLLWYLIAEANPEIQDVENIPAGYVLRIPKRA